MSTQKLDSMNSFLEELLNKRGSYGIGSNGTRCIELDGGTLIEPTAFEPDPVSYRNEYYYNAVNNVLYKKVIVRKNPIVAHWQKISN